MNKRIVPLLTYLLLILFLTACTPAENANNPAPDTIATESPSDTAVPATDTVVPAPSATPEPTNAPSPTPAPAPETFSLDFSGRVGTVEFSPDGSMVAIVDSPRIVVLDTTTWQPVFEYAVNGDYSTTKTANLAWSPTGEILAHDYWNADWDDIHGIKLWQVLDWKPKRDIETLINANLKLAFSPNGLFLAAQHDSVTFSPDIMIVYRISNRKEELQIRHNPFPEQQTTASDQFASFAWSPNGEQFATGNTYDESVTVWDTKSSDPLFNTVGLFTDAMPVNAWSPDGNHLVGGRTEGGLVVWDAATGEVLVNLFGHTKSVEAIDFHAASRLMATASRDHTVVLWDMDTWKILAVLEGNDQVLSIDFSPNGAMLVAATNSGVTIWNVANQLP